MTCKIERPDPQTLFNRLRDMFSVNVLGGANVIPESNEWYVVGNDYAMAEQFYAFSEQLFNERDPRTACCDNLITMAEADGVYPRPASFAEGYALLTGTPGVVIPSRIEIIAGGQNYVSVGGTTGTIGAAGQTIIRVRALTPGITGNQQGIATGTLTSSIDNVSREVVICGQQFCGGAPAEDCEAFRRRYTERKQYKPRMTDAFLREKIMEWPCVTRVHQRAGACCHCDEETGCGCSDCTGKPQYYVLFDGVFPCGIAPGHIYTQIEDWLFGNPQGSGLGQVEFGVCGKIYVPTPIMTNVRIDIGGCPSPAQLNQIKHDIEDLFLTLPPSTTLYTQQIDMVVANVLGAVTPTTTIIELIDPPQGGAIQDPCGNTEMGCDFMLCLNEIVFTNLPTAPGEC